MPEIFQWLDETVLLAINSMHSDALDVIMWHISGKLQWIPFYLLLCYLIWKKVGTKRTVVVLILMALLMLACDQICASLLRPIIAKPRPTNAASPVYPLLHIVNGYQKSGYGWPSCHAANTMAAATLLCMIFRERKYLLLFIWPVAVAYSRMYLGVHYPSDIIAGWGIGTAMAYATFHLYRTIKQHLPQRINIFGVIRF